jgi:hypothetical protein
MVNWFKHEKYIMNKLGLTPQPRSGSGEMFKEDGRSEKILAQLKSSEGKAISIKKSDILILIKNASIAHKKPVFCFNFIIDGHDLTFVAARPYDLFDVAREFKKINKK